MHIPSRSHLDSSIVATPSIMEMAFSGQTSTHSPEVRHFFGSTTIFMLSNLTRTGRKKLICPKARLYMLFRSLNISCFRELLLNFLKKRHEPISKIKLGFRARRETVKKRSIHVVCEHFESFRNAAMGT